MSGFSQDSMIRAAGGFAIISSIISACGIVFLIAMFIFFAFSRQEQGEIFGLLNDICVALQYMLTIPIAIALYHILSSRNFSMIRLATIIGISSMLIVIALQLALVFGFLTFKQQGVWVSLAMIGGIGAWLIMTGMVARSAGIFPNSIIMSSIAVPYIGFPVWAFWLGRHLFRL